MELAPITKGLETIRQSLLSLEHLLTRSEHALDDESKLKAIDIANNMILEAKLLQSHRAIEAEISASTSQWPDGALHKVALLLSLVCDALIEVKQSQIELLKTSKATKAILNAHALLERDLRDGVI